MALYYLFYNEPAHWFNSSEHSNIGTLNLCTSSFLPSRIVLAPHCSHLKEESCGHQTATPVIFTNIN
jgi:hypothetical protein